MLRIQYLSEIIPMAWQFLKIVALVIIAVVLKFGLFGDSLKMMEGIWKIIKEAGEMIKEAWDFHRAGKQ